jgi:hypothetical protein
VYVAASVVVAGSEDVSLVGGGGGAEKGWFDAEARITTVYAVDDRTQNSWY